MTRPAPAFPSLRGLAVALTACLLASSWSGARAAEFDGLVLPDRVTVFSEDLVVSGCGVRETFWTEVYLLGLYLSAPLTQADAVRDPRIPKALRLEVVYEGSVPEDLPDRWHGRLRGKVSADILRSLEKIYQDIESGDVVVFGYQQGRGSSVKLNGRRVAFSPDGRLIDALLELWIGPEPVSKNLRRLLMRGTC